MNNIDTLQIVDPTVQQPFLGKSLKFLQDANLEAFNNAVITFIDASGRTYDPTKVYILWGCVVTGVTVGPGTCTMTAGAIFYNGEIYTVQSTSGSVGAGFTVYSQVIVLTGTPDPVNFSDGSYKNVHNVRQFILQNMTTGSGTANLAVDNWIRLNDITNDYQVVSSFLNSWTSSGAGVRYRKQGRFLEVTGDVTNTGNINTIVFQLPTGYQPSQIKFFVSAEAGSVDVTYSGEIDTSGNVTVASNASTTNKRIVFHILCFF